jgi:cytidine deaminase
MSHNPFSADEGIRLRIESLEATAGAPVRVRIEALLNATHGAVDNSGSVIAAEDVAALIKEFGLGGPEELMLLARKSAERIARPSISSFFVGAIGFERETGNLIFGGNAEFPGTHLGTTIHGEGFVTTRAFSRGTSLAAIALGEAHPCGHCRQYISEFAAARDLLLIDPLGHRLRLSDVYPWPFDPAYLGETGAVAGTIYWPELEFTDAAAAGEVGAALLEAGKHSYAPYSKCPAAVVLTLRNSQRISGSAIESVAYNPTIGPLQAALIDLIAHGHDYADITAVALGTVADGPVTYAPSVVELLRTVAPSVSLSTIWWRP